MIRFLHSSHLAGIIGLLISVAVLTLSGCGSSAPRQKGPAVDEDLERFNRAARQAFDKGRLRQAAGLYRKALNRAYLRDDSAAILDARYNLAVCLMNLQSYEEALEVVRRAESEMRLEGHGPSPDFFLLEATILYHRRDSGEARKVTEQILSTPMPASSVVKSKAYYLQGLIASQQGDQEQLRSAIISLGQPEQPRLRADRMELAGLLAMAEQQWNVAMEAFDGAVTLRREALDYREMVNALALAGEAGKKAGHAKEASNRYLRAGRSAMLQGLFDSAREWLNRAEQIANTAGETQIAGEARVYQRQLDKLSETSPSGSTQ